MPLQRREKPHRVWMNQRKDSALTFFRTPLIPLNCMHTHIYTSTRRSEQRHTPALQSPPPAPVCATQVTAAPHPRPDSTAMPLTLCLCPSPSFHPIPLTSPTTEQFLQTKDYTTPSYSILPSAKRWEVRTERGRGKGPGSSKGRRVQAAPEQKEEGA